MYTTTPRQNLANLEYFKQLSVPNTVDEATLKEAGLVELKSGTAIFWRDATASDRSSLLDVIKAYVFDDEAIYTFDSKAEEYVRQLEIIRDEIIGEDGLFDGTKKGGVAFERCAKRSVNTNQGDRCYATTTSVEAQKNLFHPCANVILPLEGAPEDDEDLELRRKLNYVSFFVHTSHKEL